MRVIIVLNVRAVTIQGRRVVFMPESLTELARGRWYGILSELGVDPKLLVNRHVPCPLCGGVDRFRFDDRDGRGTWICSRCGAGDGPELVKRIANVDFKGAAKLVEKVVGKVQKKPPPKPAPAVTRDELNRIWKRSRPITAGSATGKYLAARCGIVESYPIQLREVLNGTPEMVALVSDCTGKPVTLHRTFLTPEGTKANIGRSARKLMPGPLPDGVAIRLSVGTALPKYLGVAEGIETAISVRLMFGIPCWSLINSVMMQKWNPPDGVEMVIIFGDNDKSFAGQAAAYKLANRLSTKLSVEVKIPDDPGDWNDVHQGQR
jgi:putative DNA primase/helicase